jgi:hypothetical protein
MSVLHFTDVAIRSLPEGYHYDETLKAFGIWVGKRRKTWIVLKEPNRTKVKLGVYPTVTLAEARKKALVALGTAHNPSKAPPFPEALEQFLALDRWKPTSKYQLTRNINRFFKWTKPVDKITHNEVAAIIEAIPKKGQAAHSLKDIKTFFNWCVPRWRTDNPCLGLAARRYKPRERVLTDEELKRTWTAAETMSACLRSNTQLPERRQPRPHGSRPHPHGTVTSNSSPGRFTRPANVQTRYESSSCRRSSTVLREWKECDAHSCRSRLSPGTAINRQELPLRGVYYSTIA